MRTDRTELKRQEDKSEIVTAFAFSLGGDFIYGIQAKRDEDDTHTGENEKIVGIPGTIFDLEIPDESNKNFF